MRDTNSSKPKQLHFPKPKYLVSLAKAVLPVPTVVPWYCWWAEPVTLLRQRGHHDGGFFYSDPIKLAKIHLSVGIVHLLRL